MDPLLMAYVDTLTPKINPIIGNGIAIEHMKHAESYIDSILRNVSKDFPDGLEYLGCQRCTPLEEYAEITKKKGSKRTFDIARSDLYLMKYFFRFKGEDIIPPRYIFLPFVSTAGSITLSGTRYVISPVLTDKVISVGMKEVFVRLLRAKLRFHRNAQTIVINGIREEVKIVWSSIYNKNAAMKKLKSPVKAETCLVHYLLAKYGFSYTFKHFGKCVPIVGTSDVNSKNYPPEEWVICQSRQIPPKGNKGVYEPTQIRIAIRREEFTPMVKSLVAGFFYVVDFFPNRVEIDYLDNTSMWMVLLGLILFSDAISTGKLHADIEKHFLSLDEYIDHLIQTKLKDIGYDIPNIYELFGLIIENVNDWIAKASDTIGSMYNKELSILYDVLYDITSSIFDMHFKLKAVTKKELTLQDIITIMSSTLRPRAIYSIMKQRKGISTVSYSGDNKIFKITSMLVPQTSSGGRQNKKERISVEDPQLRLHASIAEVGSHIFLPKADPSGRARVSPFLGLENGSVIKRDPKKVELIDSVQEIIRRW